MILAIKTTGPTTLLWLEVAKTLISNPAPTREWLSERRLADELLSTIESLLAERNVNWDELTLIAIYSGPGSFTSLRIGHTVANALADSLGIPVVGWRGDDWLSDAVSHSAQTHLGVPALPFYGADAHITRPKA